MPQAGTAWNPYPLVLCSRDGIFKIIHYKGGICSDNSNWTYIVHYLHCFWSGILMASAEITFFLRKKSLLLGKSIVQTGVQKYFSLCDFLAKSIPFTCLNKTSFVHSFKISNAQFLFLNKNSIIKLQWNYIHHFII
jgi:hypothetical protein